jgi:hypothetical protein
MTKKKNATNILLSLYFLLYIWIGLSNLVKENDTIDILDTDERIQKIVMDDKRVNFWYKLIEMCSGKIKIDAMREFLIELKADENFVDAYSIFLSLWEQNTNKLIKSFKIFKDLLPIEPDPDICFEVLKKFMKLK